MPSHLTFTVALNRVMAGGREVAELGDAAAGGGPSTSANMLSCNTIEIRRHPIVMSPS